MALVYILMEIDFITIFLNQNVLPCFITRYRKPFNITIQEQRKEKVYTIQHKRHKRLLRNIDQEKSIYNPTLPTQVDTL